MQFGKQDLEGTQEMCRSRLPSSASGRGPSWDWSKVGRSRSPAPPLDGPNPALTAALLCLLAGLNCKDKVETGGAQGAGLKMDKLRAAQAAPLLLIAMSRRRCKLKKTAKTNCAVYAAAS